MLRKVISKLGRYIILLFLLFISIFPFYWMAVGSTHSSDKIFSTPPNLIFGENLATNFQNLNANINIPRVLFNSLFVSIVALILSLIINACAAYAISKYDFKGKKLLMITLLASNMIPHFTQIIPLFRMMSEWNWLNSYEALIMPNIVYIFVLFLLKENFDQFPNELLESSRLDGAGEFYIFTRIVLPNMKPALASAAILLFMKSWNNFMWPLIVTTTTDMYTFPIALSSLRGTSYTDFGALLLGLSISTLPIIVFFLIFQRYFVQSSLGSSLKQ